MKHRYYIPIIALFLAGLIAGYFLIPASSDIALMNMRDNKDDVARAYYEKEYAQGNRSIENIQHLAGLYLIQGKIDKAINILETHMRDHPTAGILRKQLTQIYLYGQRYEEYTKSLAMEAALSPDVSTLTRLSSLYNASGEYDKQITVLQTLLATEKGNSPKTYSDLAIMLAGAGRLQEAADLLLLFKKQLPEHYKSEDAALLISLLLDLKRYDEAVSETLAVRDRQRPLANNIVHLVKLVQFKAGNDYAAKIINSYSEDELVASSELLDMKIILMSKAGNEKEAYALLTKLYDTKKLPDSFFPELLYYAVIHDDRAQVDAILSKMDLEQLSEQELINLVLAAQSHRNIHLLNAMKKFGESPQHLKTYPLFSAVLAVISHNPLVTARLAALRTLDLSKEDHLELASLCAEAGLSACAHEHLGTTVNMSELNDSQLTKVGDIYLRLKDWKKLSDLLDAAKKANRSMPLGQISLRYAAVKGDTNAIKAAIVDLQHSIDTALLSDLFYYASENGHPTLAILIGKRLLTIDNTVQRRRDVATVMIKGGLYEQAFALMIQNTPWSTSEKEDILTVLAKLASRSPEHRKQLIAYASEWLHQPAPESLKMSLIYVLIHAGQFNLVAPDVKLLADKKGGSWAIMYAQYLDKQGRYSAALPYWVKLSADPSTTARTRMDIAYALLEHGNKKDAEPIFRAAADKAHAASTQVTQLLYLWGPRLETQHIKWLITRIRAVRDNERVIFTRYLAEHVDAETLASTLKANPDLMSDPATQKVYLDAVATIGRLDTILPEMVQQAYTSRQPELLLSYASLAEDNGYPTEASLAYDEVLVMKPDHPVALRGAGLAAYARARYDVSKRHLQQYLNATKVKPHRDPELAKILYNYAQLLSRQGHKTAAASYYQQAYDKLPSNAGNSPESASMAAQIALGSGHEKEGSDLFNHAIRRYPDNGVLYADKISSLIEKKHYTEAQALLAPKLNNAAPKPQVVATTIALNRANSAIRFHSRNREVMIPFGTNKSKRDAFIKGVRQNPTIVSVGEGYDGVLLTTKSDMVFVFESHETGNVLTTVLGKPWHNKSTLDDDLTLRYQLLATRISLETGQFADAITRMEQLYPRYRRHPEYLGYAANVQNYVGSWSAADVLIKEARAAAHENEDYQNMQEDIDRNYAENITLDMMWIKRGDSREIVTTLSHDKRLTRNLTAGASLANRNLSGRNIVLPDGTTGNASDIRQTSEIYADYAFDSRRSVKVTLFGNNHTLGAGADYSFLNNLGKTTMSAAFHQPYLEFTEATLEDATRDQLAVSHTMRPSTQLVMTGSVALNRYNLEDHDNAASSISGHFDIMRTLINERPFLGIAYSVDAELIHDRETGMAADGTEFRLLPVRSQNLHMISLVSNYEFTEITYADLTVGYGVDLVGGNGASIAGALTHTIMSSMDLQLRANYGIDVGQTDNNVASVGSYLRYKF